MQIGYMFSEVERSRAVATGSFKSAVKSSELALLSDKHVNVEAIAECSGEKVLRRVRVFEKIER